jgi:hypothetical protein
MRADEAETLKRTRRMAGLTKEEQEGELDNLPPTVPVDLVSLGDGKHLLSWIWYSLCEGELSDASPEVVASTFIVLQSLYLYLIYSVKALHVEWLKTRARAHRWREEIELLLAEMERAYKFCTWKAEKWMEKSDPMWVGDRPTLSEGIRAYALEQADVECRRGELWRCEWEVLRKRASVVLDSVMGKDDQDLALDQVVIEEEAGEIHSDEGEVFADDEEDD